jgi:hypothetical protein
MLGYTDRFLAQEEFSPKAYTGIEGKYENKIVMVYRKKPQAHNILTDHGRFLDYIQHTSNHIYVFDVSNKEDYTHFMEGRYSQFSDEHKDQIKSCKSQYIKHPVLNTLIYNPLIAILERNPVIRERLEEVIGQRLSEDEELRSKPIADDLILILTDKKLSLI